MSYRRSRSSGISFYTPGFPPGVKWLLIANVAIFIVWYFTKSQLQELWLNLALVPAFVVHLFMVWQLATYMFLHGGFSHILWNMLALWMFGADVEQALGTRR